jgi:hypothetical protein
MLTSVNNFNIWYSLLSLTKVIRRNSSGVSITMEIELPRTWYLAVIGIANWQEKALDLPQQEFSELKELIENYLSRTNKKLRKKGALVASLLWSHENLSPLFLLEANRENERLLKEIRADYDRLSERINETLTAAEKESSLGKNLAKITLEGKTLLLECTIPSPAEGYPTDEEVLQVFSDAFNAELLTIKRAEHDFLGRSIWLASLDSVLNRKYIRDVGPIRKIRAAKEVEGRRNYETKTPGDFEKIVRYLSEAVPYRPSLFKMASNQSETHNSPVLGHIIVQYLSTMGDLPLKVDRRSVTHTRLGRKTEEMQWIHEFGIDWKELDKVIVVSKEIAYDNIERTITDVGGIKFDGLWTTEDISSKIYFLSKFTFTEDVLKKLMTFAKDMRSNFEKHVGTRTSNMLDIWRKAGLEFNILIFEVRALDNEEEKKLTAWIKTAKNKQQPGPTYCGDNKVLADRQFRPF